MVVFKFLHFNSLFFLDYQIKFTMLECWTSFHIHSLFCHWFHEIFTISIFHYPSSKLVQPFPALGTRFPLEGGGAVWISVFEVVEIMFWVGGGWDGLSGCLEADSPVQCTGDAPLSVGRMRLRQTQQWIYPIVSTIIKI